MPLKVTHCDCCSNLSHTARIKLRVVKFNLCERCSHQVVGEMFDLMFRKEAKRQEKAGFTLKLSELI